MRKQHSPRDDILDETVRLNSTVNGGVSSQNWEPGLIWFRVGKGSQTACLVLSSWWVCWHMKQVKKDIGICLRTWLPWLVRSTQSNKAQQGLRRASFAVQILLLCFVALGRCGVWKVT